MSSHEGIVEATQISFREAVCVAVNGVTSRRGRQIQLRADCRVCYEVGFHVAVAALHVNPEKIDQEH